MGNEIMSTASEMAKGAKGRRKTSVTLDEGPLREAKELGLNVSDVCNAALAQAVRTAARAQWIEDNRDAFAAQAAWQDENPNPFAGFGDGPFAGAE